MGKEHISLNKESWLNDSCLGDTIENFEIMKIIGRGNGSLTFKVNRKHPLMGCSLNSNLLCLSTIYISANLPYRLQFLCQFLRNPFQCIKFHV